MDQLSLRVPEGNALVKRREKRTTLSKTCYSCRGRIMSHDVPELSGRLRRYGKLGDVLDSFYRHPRPRVMTVEKRRQEHAQFLGRGHASPPNQRLDFIQKRLVGRHQGVRLSRQMLCLMFLLESRLGGLLCSPLLLFRGQLAPQGSGCQPLDFPS